MNGILNKKSRYERNILINSMEELSLRIRSGEDIIIFGADKWYEDIILCLEDEEEWTDEMKLFAYFISQNFYQMDNIAAEYNAHYGDRKFVDDFQLAIIYINSKSQIRLEYWGIKDNTQFDICFEYISERFILKSFGLEKDIPFDWNK